MNEEHKVPGSWIEQAFLRLCEDFSHCMKAHQDFILKFPSGSSVTVRAVVMEDYQNNTKHAAILVPSVGEECAAYPEIVAKS